MKKYLIVVSAVLIIAFSSCSKDSSIEPTDKEYKVSVNISNFDSSITEIKSDAIVNKSMTIYLLKNDKVIQTTDEFEVFNKLDLLLTKGNYKLCIFYKESTHSLFNQTDAGWFHLTPDVGDVFYNKVDFVVEDADVTLSEMVLERLNSRIELTINNIPDEIAHVDLLVSPTAKNLLIQHSDNFDSYAEETIVPNNEETVTIDNLSKTDIAVNTLPLQDAILNVVFYDVDGTQINTMTINNITITRNHKLNLTGDYSEDGNFDVDITIDKDWDGSSNGSF